MQFESIYEDIIVPLRRNPSHKAASMSIDSTTIGSAASDQNQPLDMSNGPISCPFELNSLFAKKDVSVMRITPQQFKAVNSFEQQIRLAKEKLQEKLKMHKKMQMKRLAMRPASPSDKVFRYHVHALNRKHRDSSFGLVLPMAFTSQPDPNRYDPADLVQSPLRWRSCAASNSCST
jgi:hypothetical protein